MLKLRLMIIAAICLAAFAIGAASALIRDAGSANVTGSSVTDVSAIAAADISSLVARLSNTGIFPAARSLNPAGSGDGGPVAGEAGAESGDAQSAPPDAQRPPIVAIVKQNDVWRIYAASGVVERRTLAVDDELYDGWIVTQIAGARLTAARDDETLTIDVFDLPDEG